MAESQGSARVSFPRGRHFASGTRCPHVASLREAKALFQGDRDPGRVPATAPGLRNGICSAWMRPGFPRSCGRERAGGWGNGEMPLVAFSVAPQTPLQREESRLTAPATCHNVLCTRQEPFPTSLRPQLSRALAGPFSAEGRGKLALPLLSRAGNRSGPPGHTQKAACRSEPGVGSSTPAAHRADRSCSTGLPSGRLEATRPAWAAACGVESGQERSRLRRDPWLVAAHVPTVR